MLFDNRTHDDKAWAIASDPSATEKQWLAACTILDGKDPMASLRPGAGAREKRLPDVVGLPWSLTISGVAGLGALLLYGFFITGLYDVVALLTGTLGIFSGALGFALISAGFAAFSSVFAYQQHVWGGGRMWPILHWTIIGFGAFLPLGVLLIFANGSTWDLLTSALWAAGFIGVSLAATICTRKSVKSLDATVGSYRLMPYTRSMLAIFGLIMIACLSLPLAAIVVSSTRWLWLPAVIIGSGSWITLANNARNPQTASLLAMSMWNPLSIANLALLPALVVNSIGALAFPVGSISVVDFAIGVGAIACLSLGPTLGARVASRSLKARAELELHNLAIHMLPAEVAEDARAHCEPDSHQDQPATNTEEASGIMNPRLGRQGLGTPGVKTSGPGTPELDAPGEEAV